MSHPEGHTRNNEEWLAALRGMQGLMAQHLAHEALARYLYTVAYNDLSTRQAYLPLLASFHPQDLAALAQEFVQDLLEQLVFRSYTLLDQFRGDALFTSWIAVILRRRIAKELKKKRWTQQERLVEDDAEQVRPPEAQFADHDQQVEPHYWAQLNQIDTILQRCLKELTQLEQIAFVRCIGEDESAKEVAQALHKSANAVNLLVHKAKRKLRSCLRGTGVDVDDLQLFDKQP